MRGNVIYLGNKNLRSENPSRVSPVKLSLNILYSYTIVFFQNTSNVQITTNKAQYSYSGCRLNAQTLPCCQIYIIELEEDANR